MTDQKISKRSFDAYNAFLIDGELDRFTKVLARYEFFKMILDLPGDIVECGVFKGQGLFFWAKLIQIFNPMSPRKVVGFDTFSGVPKTVRAVKDRIGSRMHKDYDHVPQLIAKRAEELELGRRIEVVPGDASRTIPQYIADNPGFRLALLNLDFDVYEPTLVALEELYDRMVGGGIVMVDEYAIANWRESDAVDKFIKGRGLELKNLPWAMTPTAYFKKPLS